MVKARHLPTKDASLFVRIYLVFSQLVLISEYSTSKPIVGVTVLYINS